MCRLYELPSHSRTCMLTVTYYLINRLIDLLTVLEQDSDNGLLYGKQEHRASYGLVTVGELGPVTSRECATGWL